MGDNVRGEHRLIRCLSSYGGKTRVQPIDVGSLPTSGVRAVITAPADAPSSTYYPLNKGETMTLIFITTAIIFGSLALLIRNRCPICDSKLDTKHHGYEQKYSHCSNCGWCDYCNGN